MIAEKNVVLRSIGFFFTRISILDLPKKSIESQQGPEISLPLRHSIKRFPSYQMQSDLGSENTALKVRPMPQDMRLANNAMADPCLYAISLCVRKCMTVQ